MLLKDMIDHHCHMSQTLGAEPQAMEWLTRAFDEGLFAIIDAGDIQLSIADRLALLSAYTRAYLVIGMHPLDVDHPFNFEEMMGVLDDPKVIGIGEIGLDYSRIEHDKRKQQVAFEAQLSLADQYDLPAMLHIRDAFDEAYAMVKRIGVPRVVVHCFTGGRTEAKRWLDMGAYLSFSGLITFKNASDIQDALSYTPANRILLETDSPYLSPVPHRGKTNHPHNMVHVYQQASVLTKTPLEALTQQVKTNFMELYRLHHIG